MKKSGLLLALSTLAGALLVGGTFAAWTVTDNANPFGITISADPTDVEIPEEGTITLAWGETRTLNAIEGMKRGDEKGPFSVGLLATTSDASAYEGTLTATLSSEATTEAKLIDYLEVKVYDNNTKEGAALLTANKASSYAGAANITVTSAVEKVVYFYVSLANDIADDVWNVINDNTVTLTVDWKEKAAAPEVLTEGYYLVGTNNGWELGNAYKFSAVDDHFELENVEFAAEAQFKVRDLAGENWYTSLNPWENCGFSVTQDDDHNIIVTEAGTYKVSLYIPGDDGNSVVIAKQGAAPEQPEQPEDPELTEGYYLVGSLNEWGLAAEYKFTLVEENHYRLENVEFAAEAQFKVRDLAGENWYTSLNPWPGCGFSVTQDNDHNIIVTEAGVYTVDLYIPGDDGNSVVLTKVQA